VTLRVVGHDAFEAGKLPVHCRSWSLEEQDSALLQCHIGLCPMPNQTWTQGKCPYKVLQYMANAMPWVGSSVGENLVTAGKDDGQTNRGLCAGSTEEWLGQLTRLLDDEGLRQRLGNNGRRYVEQYHSRPNICDMIAANLREIVG
jgi:glycosyltransferase involved in cell wall biosynthesis